MYINAVIHEDTYDTHDGNTRLLSLKTVVLLLLPLALTAVFLQCARDNPLDIHATNHVSGLPPEVRFVRDTLGGYVADSIAIPVVCADSAAIGGRAPSVEMLYYGWGGTETFTDSISVPVGTDTVVIRRPFGNPYHGRVFVKVRDNDGEFSPVCSALLEIRQRPEVTDTTKPRISFLSPTDSAIVNSPFISVLLTVTDPVGTAGVQVNFLSAQRAEGGNDSVSFWRLDSLRLTNDGPNTIIAGAFDRSHRSNFSSSAITIHYDRFVQDVSPPQITLQQLTDSATVQQSPLTVTVSILELSGLAAVTMNDKPMTFIRSDGNQSTYSAEVTLTPGANTLVFFAQDQKGFDTTKSSVVFYEKLTVDTVPPAITIIEPRISKQIPATEVTVVVSASDASGIAEVTIDGKTAQPVAQKPGYWSQKMTLKHKQNTIRVTATDAAAKPNTNRDSLVVFQNNDPTFDVGKIFDTTLEQGAYEALLELCATDLDGDVVGFRFAGGKPEGASITRSGNCATLHYTPTSDNLLETCRILVTDSLGGLNDTVEVRIHITKQGSLRPVISTASTDMLDSAIVGIAYVDTVKATNPGPGALVFSLGSAPEGMTVDPELGRITWTAVEADTGMHEVELLASNEAAADTLRWTVTVNMPNRPPYFINLMDKTIDESVKVHIELSAQDPDDDGLTYRFVGEKIPGLTITGNVISGYPKDGIYIIKVEVIELGRSEPLSATGSFTLTIVETPPVFKPHPPADTVILQSGKATYRDTVRVIVIPDERVRFNLVSRLPSLKTYESGDEFILSWNLGYGDMTNSNRPHEIEVVARDHAGNTTRLRWKLYVFNRKGG